MATRLTGRAALEFAEKNDCRLSKKADDRGPARDDVSIDEARILVRTTPDVIYVDFDEWLPENVA